MTPKPPTYRSAALSGLVLAATVAQDSANGAPIVSQILGAVSRIVTLAAKIENDREAFHSLTERARKLARRITAVLADRAPDGEVQAALEGIHSALCSVQNLFETHIAKTPVRRAISYLVSVPREVERLSGDLDDALQEFLLVAALDTNVRVQESSRSIGPFRQLHDFEIEKLQLLASISSYDRSCRVNCHAARVEGTARLFVVRFFEGTRFDRTDGSAAHAGELHERAEAQSNILAQMSTLEKSHPNIAYLYGRATECRHNRFIVLRTGFLPLPRIAPGLPLSSIWSMVSKLLDAARHLIQFGAVWLPDIQRLGNNIFLDDRGEPSIGIIHDLHSAEAIDLRRAYECQFVMLSEVFMWAHAMPHRGDEFWSALSRESTDPFAHIQHAIATMCKTRSIYRKIQRSNFAGLTVLNREAQSYLRIAKNALGCIHPRAESLYWSQMLCRLANGGADLVGTRLYAAYHARPTLDPWDVLFGTHHLF